MLLYFDLYTKIENTATTGFCSFAAFALFAALLVCFATTT
jgi:hypothetical protein